MQILILDTDLETSARYHCDAHCIKLILEAAQLACGVHWLNGVSAPYRLSHRHHPLFKWCQSSSHHYDYVVRYGLALCTEYTYRFGKRHATQSVLEWCAQNDPCLPDRGFEFVFVAGFPFCEDVVTSYRKYFCATKMHLARWTRRYVPPWVRRKSLVV